MRTAYHNVSQSSSENSVAAAAVAKYTRGINSHRARVAILLSPRHTIIAPTALVYSANVHQCTQYHFEPFSASVVLAQTRERARNGGERQILTPCQLLKYSAACVLSRSLSLSSLLCPSCRVYVRQ